MELAGGPESSDMTPEGKRFRAQACPPSFEIHAGCPPETNCFTKVVFWCSARHVRTCSPFRAGYFSGDYSMFLGRSWVLSFS